MKSKLIAILAVFITGSLLMADVSSFGRIARPSGQNPTVSKQGTLHELFDANGKSLFGEIGRDGFEVRYRTKGRTRSASVLGTRTRKLQTASGQPRLNGNSTETTGWTSDKALKIRSRFTYNESTRELTIERSFTNVSKSPVTLKWMRIHIDPNLVMRGQTKTSSSRELEQSCLSQIKAGIFLFDCEESECVLGPLCPRTGCPLPPPVEPRAKLQFGKSDVILNWQLPIKLAAKSPRTAAKSQATIIVLVKVDQIAPLLKPR